VAEVRKLWIPGPAGKLEAAVRLAEAACATAVVAHPHPLYGGTLDNPVVFHAERELHELGLTTLRFNFRGVGESEGEHDAGRGEVEDLAGAVSWIRGSAPNAPLILVGYSFGAWCAIRYAARDRSVCAIIAIGLPTRTYSFDEIDHLGRPLVVVQGSEDEFGSPDEVRVVLEKTRPRAKLLVVEGSSHLFPELARAAASRVREAAGEILASLDRLS
jgi:alpha/beta superfamily hydrolase